nr:hypothetical protein [candidate division Zixibacteria bacterium]
MPTGNKKTGLPATVIAEYRTPYPDPLVIKAGEKVQVEPRPSEWPGWIWCVIADGRSGWVPKKYIDEKHGLHLAAVDYSAAELNVAVGDNLTIIKQESGWAWCENSRGDQGWVPLDNLDFPSN